jgi:hypothetical protein
MAGSFRGKLGSGEAIEFGMDNRDQLFQSRIVTITPGPEHNGDLTCQRAIVSHKRSNFHFNLFVCRSVRANSALAI